MNKLYIALALSLIAIVVNLKFSLNNQVHKKEVSIKGGQNSTTYRKESKDSFIFEKNSIDIVNLSEKIEKKDSIINVNLTTNNKKSKSTEGNDYIKTGDKNNEDQKNTDINNENSLIILTSTDEDQEKIYKLANKISQENNKEAAKLIIDAMLENFYLGNFSNLEILQEALEEFNSTEAIEELLDATFSDPELSAAISQLPNATQYAIKKAIYTAPNRDDIASKLTAIYQNSTDDEEKYKIARFIYPEAYAMIAVEAYHQGDTNLFTEMTQNLTSVKDKHAVDGLMILARKIDTSSIDTITEIAKKWSKNNLSENTESLAIDYLSNGISATPKERIIATAILANTKNKDKDKVLEKAWNYEEDDLVKTYINQYRYDDLKDAY